MSDFVGEVGPDPFEDSENISIHYLTKSSSSPEVSLPAEINTVFEGDELASAQLCTETHH